MPISKSYRPTQPWKCGLCEKSDNPPEVFECLLCYRDRSIEYRWDYNFKMNCMEVKHLKPFSMPERIEPPPLALGWAVYYDEEGYVYYYNEETQESTYERPVAAITSEESRMRPPSPHKPESPRRPDSPRKPSSPRWVCNLFLRTWELNWPIGIGSIVHACRNRRFSDIEFTHCK